MSGYVIDASAILCWCFEDEAPRGAAALLRKLTESEVFAPAHWPLEVCNTLWTGERRKRISPEDADTFIALVDGLDVRIDHDTGVLAWGVLRALARAEALTVYDAAYLELADRLGATLVSKDKALLAAARKAGVRVIDVSVA